MKHKVASAIKAYGKIICRTHFIHSYILVLCLFIMKTEKKRRRERIFNRVSREIYWMEIKLKIVQPTLENGIDAQCLRI